MDVFFFDLVKKERWLKRGNIIQNIHNVKNMTVLEKVVF